MRKILYIVFVLIIVILQTGCSTKNKLDKDMTIFTEKDLINTQIYGNQRLIDETEEGLFILDDGKIYVKVDGSSIVNLIDTFGFKKRINYTVLSQLPNKRLKIANRDDLMNNLSWSKVKGKVYNNFNELKNDLILWMNYVDTDAKYEIQETSSGLVIKNDKDSSKSYTKVFLFNTSAEEIKKNIDEFYSSGTKPEYSIVTLSSQNAIIVSASPTVLEGINDIIIPLDSTAPQVLIEAQVFEYHDTLNRLIGTALEYTKQGTDYTQVFKSSFGERVVDTLPKFFNELTNTAKKQTLLYAIAAQDRDGEVKVMAEPRILLKPGSTAEINMNTQKYVIVTGVNTSKLESIDTGITLKITPSILSEKTILLNLELEQSDFIPTNEANIVQSVNKNTIKTSIITYDGELVSLGGIYVQKGTNFNSGIPYLKDIPIAGVLFGSQDKSSNKLMVDFMIRASTSNASKRLDEIKQNSYKLKYEDENGKQKEENNK